MYAIHGYLYCILHCKIDQLKGTKLTVDYSKHISSWTFVYAVNKMLLREFRMLTFFIHLAPKYECGFEIEKIATLKI